MVTKSSRHVVSLRPRATEDLPCRASFDWRNLDSFRQSKSNLNNWKLIEDQKGINIIDKLGTLSGSAGIHLQRISSHVNLKYDIADELAKGGTLMTPVNEEPLNYLELYLKCKASINICWKQPPLHPWYLSQCPEASICFKGNRRDQTTFARQSTGYLKSLRFAHRFKTFPVCIKCNYAEATPQHLLDLGTRGPFEEAYFGLSYFKDEQTHRSGLIQTRWKRKKILLHYTLVYYLFRSLKKFQTAKPLFQM
ncbi:uncharacterized protein TNCV_4782271 [Trichonephila clavipes]|nr:uncharacterized protein TNCV_4782271 [Trichonephila clavipes]